MRRALHPLTPGWRHKVAFATKRGYTEWHSRPYNKRLQLRKTTFARSRYLSRRRRSSGNGHGEKSKRPRQSTTARSDLSATVFSANVSSVRHATSSATAESTSVNATCVCAERDSSATSARSKLPARQCVESEWDTLTSRRQLHTSGFRRGHRLG